MSTISAILLAAGESRRMESVNKLAILIDETPLLRCSVQTLLASQLQEVIVVVGYEEAQSRSLLEGLSVTIVSNKDYKQGQMTSVHTGLEALSQPCDGVMICLADQPLLSTEDINTLIAAFEQRTPGTILVPTFRGLQGNPIILADEHRKEILQGERNLGCKNLIKRHPEWVSSFEMDCEDVVMDLDSPEDFAVLEERLSERGHRMVMPS